MSRRGFKSVIFLHSRLLVQYMYSFALLKDSLLIVLFTLASHAGRWATPVTTHLEPSRGPDHGPLGEELGRGRDRPRHRIIDPLL